MSLVSSAQAGAAAATAILAGRAGQTPQGDMGEKRKPAASAYTPQVSGQAAATASAYTPQISGEAAATASAYTPQIRREAAATATSEMYSSYLQCCLSLLRPLLCISFVVSLSDAGLCLLLQLVFLPWARCLRRSNRRIREATEFTWAMFHLDSHQKTSRSVKSNRCLSLCLCLSLYLSLSVCLSLCLSVSVSFSVCLCLSVSLCVYIMLSSLSLCLLMCIFRVDLVVVCCVFSSVSRRSALGSVLSFVCLLSICVFVSLFLFLDVSCCLVRCSLHDDDCVVSNVCYASPLCVSLF